MSNEKETTTRSNSVDEWKTCRGLLADFDGRLHDLRKYGFSFITALLSAESILLPSIPSLLASGKALPDSIKWTVFLVDLMLIVTLCLIDRNYQVFQSAAATRALVLERTLNLELTEVITQRYDDQHVRWGVAAIYGAFTAGVLVLGSSALYPNYILIEALEAAGVFALLLILALQKVVRVDYPYGKMDWTIDRLECTQDEEVAVTVTNLSKSWKGFNAGEEVWQLKKEDGTPVKTKTLDKPVKIRGGDSYTWLLPTGGLEPGIYRVWRIVEINGERAYKPLLRKLRIRAKPLRKEK